MKTIYERGDFHVMRWGGLYFYGRNWQLLFHGGFPFVMINAGRFYFGLK